MLKVLLPFEHWYIDIDVLPLSIHLCPGTMTALDSLCPPKGIYCLMNAIFLEGHIKVSLITITIMVF